MTALGSVGFIGLGDQGEPMAHRILAAGLPLHLWARRPESLVPFQATSAQIAPSPRELASEVDILCLCTFAEEDLNDLLFREPDGIVHGLRDGSVLVIHNTVSPDCCREIAATLSPAGVTVLDAPVSGGRARAFAGELSVMVGGDRAAFDRLQALFGTYGSTIRHLGPAGSGQSAKILNNALMIANLQLADEALAAAARLGLDAHAFQDLLLGSTAASTSLRILVGLERGGKSPASGPDVIRKDIALFERLCRRENIDPSGIAAASLLAARRADALLRS